MILSNGEYLMHWPVENHRITAGWTYGDGSYHGALDLGIPLNSNVVSAFYGKITRVYTWNGVRTQGDTNSYGNFIDVEHTPYKGMTLKTRYAHLNSFKVKVGDVVKEGQLIALSGSTGNSTGPHLHFEVLLNGKRTNPLDWLDDDFYKAYSYVNLGTYTSVKVPETSNNKEESKPVNQLQRICIIGASDTIKEKAKSLGLKTQDVTATLFEPASNGDAMTLWGMAQSAKEEYFSRFIES